MAQALRGAQQVEGALFAVSFLVPPDSMLEPVPIFYLLCFAVGFLATLVRVAREPAACEPARDGRFKLGLAVASALAGEHEVDGARVHRARDSSPTRRSA